jgi:hypothetical protein
MTKLYAFLLKNNFFLDPFFLKNLILTMCNQNKVLS